MRLYKKITDPIFIYGNNKLIPVRDEDKYPILNWRNEQIDILRQEKPLTIDQQEAYFKNVIDPLFELEEPDQFIFSYFENDTLIGYGGLVHIDWINRTAEVSFLTETIRAKDQVLFIRDWENYLRLLKQIAGNVLNFNTIYTYAYDVRPNLYVALERSGFVETERIKNKITISGRKKDVVIHSLSLNPIAFDFATEADCELYYNWANDPEVRKFSFNHNQIKYEDHVKWFNLKIRDPNYKFYIFRNKNGNPVGQVRINTTESETIIGISIDKHERGLGYGSKMLKLACSDYFSKSDVEIITAYIKVENVASLAIFKKAGFVEQVTLFVNDSNAIKLRITK